jgi:hypothetical protein
MSKRWMPEKSSVWEFQKITINDRAPANLRDFNAMDTETSTNGVFMVIDDPIIITGLKKSYTSASIVSIRILCKEFGIRYFNYTTDSDVMNNPDAFFKKIA